MADTLRKRHRAAARPGDGLRRTLVAALVALAACGPITYVNQVAREASSEVDAARTAQADKYAPYWFTLAVEYLAKAREEAAYSDFQSANRFGERAAEAARKAVAESLARAGRAGGGADPMAPAVTPAPVEDSP